MGKIVLTFVVTFSAKKSGKYSTHKNTDKYVRLLVLTADNQILICACYILCIAEMYIYNYNKLTKQKVCQHTKNLNIAPAAFLNPPSVIHSSERSTCGSSWQRSAPLHMWDRSDWATVLWDSDAGPTALTVTAVTVSLQESVSLKQRRLAEQSECVKVDFIHIFALLLGLSSFITLVCYQLNRRK